MNPLLADFLSVAGSVWQYVAHPIQHADWSAPLSFWAGRVLDDRFLVIYFVPLLLILLLLRRDRLRVGIVATGLVFVAYVFGLLYAVFWILSCLVFYRLAERFAIECRRTDVLPIGPPLAAGLVIGGWLLVSMVLHELTLPTDFNAWLHTHVPWVYPMGIRGMPWEPTLRLLHNRPASSDAPQLFYAIFYNVHNIGVAYLAVRMLHYFAEIKRGNLPAERRTRLNFLAYVMYAPTLIQGPIERFEEFQSEMDACDRRRGSRSVAPAIARMAMGIAKSLVSTLYFHPLFIEVYGFGGANTYYTNPAAIESFALLYFGVFFQIFALYLEFSGYCDVAAGMARLLGYRQVENFKMPWIATSMRDFWRRWHISLSFILRDYVYIALGGNRRHVSLNLIITFTLCGIWHALIPQVAIWGIIMGLMVAINQSWVNWMKRLDAAETGTLPAIRRNALKLHPLPQVTAWLVTQHAFVFSLLMFFGGAGAIRVAYEIFRRIWAIALPPLPPIPLA